MTPIQINQSIQIYENNTLPKDSALPSLQPLRLERQHGFHKLVAFASAQLSLKVDSLTSSSDLISINRQYNDFYNKKVTDSNGQR